MSIEVEEVSSEEDDAEFEELIEELANGNFEVLGEDFPVFAKFVEEQALLHGGFMISFALFEGGKVWFYYEFLNFNDDDNMTFKSPVCYVPNDPTDASCPEGYEKYPVFALGEDSARA